MRYRRRRLYLLAATFLLVAIIGGEVAYSTINSLDQQCFQRIRVGESREVILGALGEGRTLTDEQLIQVIGGLDGLTACLFRRMHEESNNKVDCWIGRDVVGCIAFDNQSRAVDVRVFQKPSPHFIGLGWHWLKRIVEPNG